MKIRPPGMNAVSALYLRLIRKQKYHIGAYLLLILLTAGLQLPIPFLMSNLIDGLTRGANSQALLMITLGIVGLSLLSLLLSVLGEIYSATLNRRFLIDIRLMIFKALQHLPLQFSREFDVSDLQARFTGDIGTLNHLLPTGLANTIRHVCFVLAFGAILVYTSPDIVLYIVGFLLLAVIIFKFTNRRLSALAEDAQIGYAQANATILESLKGLREGKITGSHQLHFSRLQDSLDSSEQKLFRVRCFSALIAGGLGIIPILVTSTILIIGISKVSANEISIGQLVSFMLILSMLYGPISGLFDAVSGYIYELAAFKRVATLYYVPSDPSADHACKVEEIATVPIHHNESTSFTLELRDVVFSYRTTPIIDRLNAVIPAGCCTALVGANGAGKSTLASLIAGLDYPSSGSIYLNETPLHSLSKESIADHYGYVPQDVLIFGDSLRINITMGRDISDDQIISTIKELGWENFLAEWEQGLDTHILESGRNLSGGQQQKIALLRALANQPSVLILDEPENNLEKVSLEKLVRYLEKLKGRCTVVLVTHGNAFQDVIDTTLHMKKAQEWKK